MKFKEIINETRWKTILLDKSLDIEVQEITRNDNTKYYKIIDLEDEDHWSTSPVPFTDNKIKEFPYSEYIRKKRKKRK